MKQKTIARSAGVSGVGLHTGAPVRVELRPAAPGSGIRFFKKGLLAWSAGESPAGRDERSRCSRVGRGESEILTVEHLLAAVSGLGITNLDIHVDGGEVPALDGSALGFVQLIRSAGTAEQGPPCDVWAVSEPIFCSDREKAIAAFPDPRFSVGYVLDYDFPGLSRQSVSFEVTPEIFEREIAPARTFCTETEVEALRAAGLGRGADATNTVVVAASGSHGAGLRFADECARHKVLDLLGDLRLLGFPIQGRVVGIRSGHSLNRRLVEAIQKQRDAMKPKTPRAGAIAPMDTEAIKAVLPHRDPFLFLDRIVEHGETSIVAIKKLTGNEPFFKGHFPGQPVMPGVLMIEALAQAGGVLMLARSENHGKIAYLASVTNARFRKIVQPGDELRLEVEVIKMKSKVGVMRGVAKVGGEEVCDAEIMFSLGVNP